jgi:hypothetical protein
MVSDVQSGGRPARPFSRRQLLKSSVATGVLAAGIGGGVSACDLDDTFNPEVADWMKQLAFEVGAGLVGDVLKKGLAKAWARWGPQVGASLEGGLADGSIEEGALAAVAAYHAGRQPRAGIVTDAYVAPKPAKLYVPGNVGYGHPVPPVILVQVAQKPAGHPPTDCLVAYVTTGKQHIVLPPWAWQTLLSFTHSLTSGQDGANLDIARAGCALSLLPSAVRPKTGGSPEGSVDWLTYHTKNGWVEISRVATSNTSVNGVLTTSSITDSNTGKPLILSFPLPA